MVEHPSWSADSYSDYKDIPCFIRLSILRYFHPVNISTLYLGLFMTRFNIIFTYTDRHFKLSLPLRFHNKNCMCKFFIITDLQYEEVKQTKREASQHVIFSIPL
jgi:hypothetical protein